VCTGGSKQIPHLIRKVWFTCVSLHSVMDALIWEP
jgi:hypothetical protein